MNSAVEPGRFDIVARIAQCVPDLRPAERDVAALILDDLAAAARASIGELAQRAGVSVASVTRFAKTVGCQDVRELKLRLAQAAAVGERFLRAVPAVARKQEGEGKGRRRKQRAAEASVEDASADVSLATRVYEEIHGALARNHELLRQAPFADAAAALANARMIYVFGMGGGSSALADEMRFRLVRLGRPVASYQDSLLQRMVASTLAPDCVVVALSVTGRVPELLDACRIARDYGAKLIALTAPASPLAALADWLVPIVASETDFIYKPSSSRYAMMMALDVLVTKLAMSQPEQSRELLRRMKHTLDAHRGTAGRGGERQPLGD
ncbi:DNA-binding MurR/RpiR family transcriptional regulator [Paraburkholderia bannensis]|uniref:DNA-binding MurR/RpiR family transcriptional regulator n=1 Tax=Paraburkholderia bannensis TaxID=765414 RepID=A0A7W9WRK5_9BURK|nr:MULTISPECIES: MurR/RpiR family transcriptional regulator [Paraburkholderia]MBB3256322.1 DNA-binding MurR/RpiR family transcriptional regulator [Paraburkholderia sp. WP4_3_2]MBB6101322.1 DNA-binding MurR/RpiR family transcriptional regulator [Paraburkholderia bannensis]